MGPKILELDLSWMPRVFQFILIQIWWFITYSHHYKYTSLERMEQMTKRRFLFLLYLSEEGWFLMQKKLKFRGKS